MIAAPRQHPGHHILLTDVRLGHVLDLNACRRRQLLRTGPNRVAHGSAKRR
jgi:hypothetical protein